MEPNKIFQKNSIFKIILLIIVIISLLSYIFWGEYRLKLSTQKIEELKTQNQIYNQELNNLKGINASSTESFDNIYTTLVNEKKNLEEKVTTLDKITKSDPELLKKYSKVYFLSENYRPSETQTILSEYTLNKKQEYRVHVDVVYFLQNMIDDARKEGLDLLIISAYRSFETQTSLKARNKLTYGANTANRFVAEQGYSEHQLGTTVDLTTTKIADTSMSFELTPEYRWLQENAYKYGFILSYPKGNAYYAYEPWHWRFVGRALATQLHIDNIYFYNLDQRFIDEYLVGMFDK